MTLSSSDSVPAPSSAAELLEQLKAYLQNELVHLDSSRSAFVQDTANTLYALVNDRLRGASRRRLLLGRKGVGKTTLLSTLLQASCERLTSRHLLCVYVSYGAHGSADQLLTDLVLSSLREQAVPGLPQPEEAWSRVSELDQWLKRSGRYLFLVIDEFQFTFTGHCAAHGRDIIMQAMDIGESRLGRIHCVLSGSSSVLRRLCFSKGADELSAADFPNYIRGLDLNSTKFNARWIHPFLDPSDFTAVVSANTEHQYTDSELAELYMHTGGSGRILRDALVDNAVPTVTPYSLTLRGDLTARQHEILREIYKAVISLRHHDLDENVSELEHVTSCLRLVPEDLVVNMVNDSDHVYRLADAGLVRFDEQKRGIGLGTPAIFAHLALVADATFALSELQVLALLFPMGDRLGPIAEAVATRCLARGAQALFNLSQPLLFDQPSVVRVLVLPAPNAPKSACPPPESAATLKPQMSSPPPPHMLSLERLDYRGADVATLCSHIWKESYKRTGNDKFGADAVVFGVENQTSLVVHRVQIKLGRGTGDLTKQKEWAQQVIDRFREMAPVVAPLYQAGRGEICLKSYLLTTRQMASNVCDMLKNADITVFSRDQLQMHVWPKCIQELASHYR